MLEQILESFKIKYDELGEALIVNTYTPKDGYYVILDDTGDDIRVLSEFMIKVDKKTGEIDKAWEYYDFVAEADYLSSLIDMNKPIDPKKIIHSNNSLSFFVKRESIVESDEGKIKLTQDTCLKYFEILKNPMLKYKDKKIIEIYKAQEEKYGKIDEKRIGIFSEYIMNNIYEYGNKISGNVYVKFFLKEKMEVYKGESEKYVLPNIYNKSEHIYKTKNELVGMPNDNIGLNSKKPYLENKTRKISVPYLLNQENVILQKKLFDYLYNLGNAGYTMIYINDETIKSIKSKEYMDKDFSGMFLRIKKGKELEIIDMDFITGYSTNISPLKVKNVLDVETGKEGMVYTIYHELYLVHNLVNEILFRKWLQGNYFTEAKDIRINDSNLKENILVSRDTLFRWFYKGVLGNETKSVLEKAFIKQIKSSVVESSYFTAVEQFNLWMSLKDYFEGGTIMADKLKDMKDSLRYKIRSMNTESIENDGEYYFAIGQLSKYFISKNKGSKVKQSTLNPIINGKSELVIKETLFKLYKKYNHDIEHQGMSKRFNNLYAMVLAYTAENSKINTEAMLAGYLNNSLIYEKDGAENG